jgi:hypothetical protein
MKQREQLVQLWADLDHCLGCRDGRFAIPNAPKPARPSRTPRDRSVLFLGEAPPTAGGFWKPQNHDAVRRLLLPLLPAWPEELDVDSRQAIDWFVDAGFFFLQTVKWPLIHQSYLRLTTSQRRLAVGHAVEHLKREIEWIQPRAVIGLGAGAWDGCSLLAEQYGGAPLGKYLLTEARLRHHSFRQSTSQVIPLHVTFLPGKINESLVRGRIEAIRADIGLFLNCTSAARGCEIAARQSPTLLHKPNARRTDSIDATGFLEWKARMKAARLWPVPKDMTVEAMMEELERRETDKRRTARGDATAT